MAEKIRVEQAIFGYKEGHNLISSSVPLTPRVRHFLAGVTDGSGPDVADGFEISFTGLPVPETNLYCVFCTWQAPEMPRPGCVWSHALFIDLADFTRIADFAELRRHFVKPLLSKGFMAYEKSLAIDLSAVYQPISANERTPVLLSTLYEQPDKGVVVLSDSSASWEDTVFSLWSQQWPKLRRTFAFSTASLNDRRTTGINFDIQIAPENSRRFWGRSGLPTVLIDSQQKVPQEAWLEVASSDIHYPNLPLRNFFFTYGIDVDSLRSAYKPLIEFFVDALTKSNQQVLVQLTSLGSAFPEPKDAFTLKRDQLDKFTTRAHGDPETENLWAAIYFLLNSPQAGAFGLISFPFEFHMKELWPRKKADILSLLGGISDQGRANDFLKAFCRVIGPKDIPLIWHEQPASIPRLLEIEPSLASGKAAWAMSETGQRALWQSLHEATRDQFVWSATCCAMLSAQVSYEERETVSLSGIALLDNLLNWVTSPGFKLPPSSWRHALRVPLSEALPVDELPLALLALAFWTLPSEKARTFSGTRSDVQSLAVEGLRDVPKALVPHTLFWLVTIGLQTDGKEGCRILQRSFFPVYDAVYSSTYSGENWEVLASVLPEAILGLDWDRCGRLRKALGYWFQRNPDFRTALKEAAGDRNNMHFLDWI